MSGIEVHSLYKSFNERQVLNDLNFTVEPGEIFGFIGANGAGKTTTMRIILGVLSIGRGQVLLGGKPIDAKTRTTIGYLPEERGLYPKMKVREQLIYLSRLHGLTKEQAGKNATYWMDRLGLTPRAQDEVEKLSLGNQQRVQLAVALAHEPTALVLDEPFSGLDPLAVEEMSAALREKSNDGAPVIFSSHQLRLVEDYCDKVGILSGGQLIACGTVNELRNSGGTTIILRLDEEAKTAVADIALPPGVSRQDCSFSPPYWQIKLQVDPMFHPDLETLKDQILRTALAAGRVFELKETHPPLSEIYREAISQDTPVKQGGENE